MLTSPAAAAGKDERQGSDETTSKPLSGISQRCADSGAAPSSLHRPEVVIVDMAASGDSQRQKASRRPRDLSWTSSSDVIAKQQRQTTRYSNYGSDVSQCENVNVDVSSRHLQVCQPAG